MSKLIVIMNDGLGADYFAKYRHRSTDSKIMQERHIIKAARCSNYSLFHYLILVIAIVLSRM